MAEGENQPQSPAAPAAVHVTGNADVVQSVTVGVGGSIHGDVVGRQNVYQYAVPRAADAAQIAAAEALLTSMPTSESEPISDIIDLPHGSYIKTFSPNPLFVGREPQMRAIARMLKVRDGGWPAAIVTGMGGVGKTQLAIEFAHRYGQYFAGGVFWLNFERAESVPEEIAACGPRGLVDWRPDYGELKLDEQVRHVLAAWQSPLPRLLIFDNCEDEALLAKWRPPTGGCRVLVTSRRATWSKQFTHAPQPLGVLSRDESIALLRQHRPDITDSDADAIAAELGDLPLALHMAGSYLETYQHDPQFGNPADFLRELRDRPVIAHPALQGEDVAPAPTEHVLHVGQTFALSYERLHADDPVDVLAIELLARAAQLAPGAAIPRALLLAALGLPANNREEARRAAKAIHRLVGLGMLEQEGEGSLRMHRLVAAFVREMIDDDEAQIAVEQALIDAAYVVNQAGKPAAMQPILIHLRYITERAMGRADIHLADLCYNLGSHLRQIADYAAARPLLERACQIDEQVLGPDHPDTAVSLNNLALLFRIQGDYSAARPLYERALQIHEQALGPDHPDTAASLNSLAMLFGDQGDYIAAQSLAQRALQIREQALGPDHPDIAASLNSLANLLYDQGDYSAARPLYERALQIREQVLGPDHPDTAISLNNLANLLCAQGDYSAARPLYERDLQICEQVLGPDHPDTATTLSNLAKLFCAQEDYATAQPLAQRALQIREQVLGPDYPDTATSLDCLAELFYAQEDYATAQPLAQRALQIREQALGPNHPATAASLRGLGLLLFAQGDYATARPLLKRAIQIYEQVLGPDHLTTASSLHSLAVLLDEQGDYRAAQPLLERAFQIRERTLGPDHPDTAISRQRLAAIEQLLNDDVSEQHE